MESYNSSPLELECPANSSDGYEEVELGLTSPKSDEADSMPARFNHIEFCYDHASSSSSSTSLKSQQDGHDHTLFHRRLSTEYQPKVFGEIVGHHMIIRALSNAIRWKRLSSLYLFYGPGGTGKTSVAKIFTLSLNCESSGVPALKPCWGCTGCSQSLTTAELSFKNIHTFLQSNASQESSSSLKVFIIENELASDKETWPWGELLNLAQDVEENKFDSPVVIILIIEDASRVPRAVSSRCQKFNFSKLKDTDVLLKLSRIVTQEGIDVRKNALKLIARKADGNLREAENLLDQLALLDLKIDTSMIQQLAGLAPRNRLSHLLQAALSGSSTETVKCTRDLIGFGIEPHLLVSQLASLVTELVADSSSSLQPILNDQKHIKGSSQLRKKLPDRLCRALKILTETEKQLIKLQCNPTALITAALLQIASDGFPYHIPTVADGSPDAQENVESKGMNANRHTNKNESSETTPNQLTDPVAHHLSNIIVNPDADIKGVDMDQLWHNILMRIKSNSLRNFLKCQAELVSLTASRANAIVHLILNHPKEFSDESMENTLKEALGCPVTLNISNRPVHQDTATGNCITQIPRSTKEKSASMESRGLKVKPRVNLEYMPTAECNLRSAEVQNSVQKLQMCTEGTGQGVIMAQKGQKTQNPFLSDRLNQGDMDRNPKDPQMDSSGRDHSLHTASIARTTELKLRLLSVSSIPLTDASIEPYSQDLLFEEANPDRKQGGRYSKLYKDFPSSKQQRHNLYSMGLNRSKSCTENFRKGENMENEDIMGLATRSNLLKWTYPCRESTSIKSVINSGEPNLKKSFPSTRSSAL